MEDPGKDHIEFYLRNVFRMGNAFKTSKHTIVSLAFSSYFKKSFFSAELVHDSPALSLHLNQPEFLKRVLLNVMNWLEFVGITCVNCLEGVFIYSPDMSGSEEKFEEEIARPSSNKKTNPSAPFVIHTVRLLKKASATFLAIGYFKAAVGLYNLIQNLSHRNVFHSSWRAAIKNYLSSSIEQIALYLEAEIADPTTFHQQAHVSFFDQIPFSKSGLLPMERSILIPNRPIIDSEKFPEIPVCQHHLLCCKQDNSEVGGLPSMASQTTPGTISFVCPLPPHLNCGISVVSSNSTRIPQFSWP